MPGPDRVPRVPPGEITPPDVYFNRRNFLRAGALALTAGATTLAYRRLNPAGGGEIVAGELAGVTPALAGPEGFRADPAADPMTPLERVGNYNNYYEFTTDKEAVASAAAGFVARPWTVEVGGLCLKPKTFDLDEILGLGALEERVYRMRCVEGWSMVIPWDGLPLSRLLAKVEPTGAAKYVAFETLLDPERLPGQKGGALQWPYVEGLRLDEAMHPLTILAAGLYGRELPGQNGAPLRLVVPWKYGFKGIKSIVRITLTADVPPTSWARQASHEYGFYANVNPAVAHPRWSQATEQRLGESGRRPTLPFNGYAEQVAHLYAGMDLSANY